MHPRSIFPRPADAPLRLRLVLGWGAFFLFALVGLWLYARHGGSVPVMLDVARP